MSKVPAPTLADATFARVRADILKGRLLPGSKMTFAELGVRYGVSAGVLREVLPRLVEQGLATTEPQLGYRVVSVSKEDLLSLNSAREEIEALVVRQAIRNGDLRWEASLVAAHHVLAQAVRFEPDGTVCQEWLTAHDTFHLALLNGCGNHHLVDIAVRLRSIAEVYRCWSGEETLRSGRDVAGEHRALMDAALARDAERCSELTMHHIRRTTEALLTHPAVRTAP